MKLRAEFGFIQTWVFPTSKARRTYLFGRILFGALLVSVGSGKSEAQPRSADERSSAVAVGRSFVARLLDGDVQGARRLAAVPFRLEGEVLETDSDVVRAFQSTVASRRLSGLRILGATGLSEREARRTLGPPPGRLGGLPRGREIVVLVRLTRGGIVLFLDRTGSAGPRLGNGLWKVVGVTD